jgi:biotin transport system permease protein
MSTGGIGLYQPGSSVLHRMPAGAKLTIMLVAMVGVFLLHSWWALAIAAAVLAGLYAVARIPLRSTMAQLWPMRYLLLIVGTLQVFLAGWLPAVMVCGTLLVTVAIAALVTLTTRVSAMLDAVTALLRPLRRLGVDPDRVGLVLAMTIRCVPLMVTIVRAVSEARTARGLGFSVPAMAVPVVLRTLRSADALGEALIARGMDD